MSRSLDENLGIKPGQRVVYISNCNPVLMMFFFLSFFVIIIFSLLKLSVTFLMAFFLSFFSDVFINATGRLSLFLE